MNTVDPIASFIFVFVGFIVGHLFGQSYGAEIIKERGVECGVAEYYLDTNNDKQWRFITQEN